MNLRLPEGLDDLAELADATRASRSIAQRSGGERRGRREWGRESLDLCVL
eukprot:CAMPEP_0182468716 /NCGR_PEP_ID=MMETSP1319-20130603/15923_1 /TAXON_ID=172717 /ORGANISM="Bolidomonas pacifica, Strain RCC208" /LENGTH=49 /DNA_ID=CAMNT_0024668945 /DNA_START=53 /DNA_END=202 /DNA_ORIENTATION=-